ILQKHGNHTLQLTSVRLHFEGSNRTIGLDDTEWPRSRQPAVHFFGIVKIDKLEWLSEQGLEYLQADLTRRDLQLSGKAPSRPVQLTSLYQSHPTFGEGSNGLSVWVRGKKTVSANFMNGGLCISVTSFIEALQRNAPKVSLYSP